MKKEKKLKGFHTIKSKDHGWKPGMPPIYFSVIDDNGKVVEDPEVIKEFHDKMMNSGPKFKKLLDEYISDDMKNKSSPEKENELEITTRPGDNDNETKIDIKVPPECIMIDRHGNRFIDPDFIQMVKENMGRSIIKMEVT